jgi:hypothetical protein
LPLADLVGFRGHQFGFQSGLEDRLFQSIGNGPDMRRRADTPADDLAGLRQDELRCPSLGNICLCITTILSTVCRSRRPASGD